MGGGMVGIDDAAHGEMRLRHDFASMVSPEAQGQFQWVAEIGWEKHKSPGGRTMLVARAVESLVCGNPPRTAVYGWVAGQDGATVTGRFSVAARPQGGSDLEVGMGESGFMVVKLRGASGRGQVLLSVHCDSL
jgi:hypothetical protein